jgi:hypothetical protein
MSAIRPKGDTTEQTFIALTLVSTDDPIDPQRTLGMVTMIRTPIPPLD